MDQRMLDGRRGVKQQIRTLGSRIGVRHFVCMLSTAMLLSSGVAQAAPLGLVGQNPDIGALGVDITYDAVSTNFNIFSTLSTTFTFIDAGGASHSLTGGSYVVSALIDNSGALTSGTVTVTGSVPDFGAAGVLLSGTLTAFGFAPDPNSGTDTFGLFEFLLDVNSSAPGLGFGSKAGITAGSFDLPAGWDFSLVSKGFRGTGDADTFSAVPEPSSLSFMIMGVVGLIVAVSVRRARQACAHQS